MVALLPFKGSVLTYPILPRPSNFHPRFVKILSRPVGDGLDDELRALETLADESAPTLAAAAVTLRTGAGMVRP
jgi:hypothetical protein